MHHHGLSIRRHGGALLMLLAGCAGLLLAVPAAAQSQPQPAPRRAPASGSEAARPRTPAEFRIETRVYMANEKEPASENLTLFRDGVVYDYIVTPREVTVFDPDRGRRFVLLDLDRKLRTTIPTNVVADYIQGIRQRMAQLADDEVQRFFQNPRFEVAVDPDTRRLSLDSPYLHYRLATVAAKSDEVLRAYIRFANAYAQLNTVTKPGSTPPFPRMAVNDELERRGLIPTEIEFTATNPSKLAGARSVTLRSVHGIDWRLFAEDLKRIDETKQQLVAFKHVSPQEYLQLSNSPLAPPQQAQKPSRAKPR